MRVKQESNASLSSFASMCINTNGNSSYLLLLTLLVNQPIKKHLTASPDHHHISCQNSSIFTTYKLTLYLVVFGASLYRGLIIIQAFTLHKALRVSVYIMCLISNRDEDERIPTREAHVYRDGSIGREYPARRSYASSHAGSTTRMRHVYHTHSPRTSHTSHTSTYRTSQPVVIVDGGRRRSFY